MRNLFAKMIGYIIIPGFVAFFFSAFSLLFISITLQLLKSLLNSLPNKDAMVFKIVDFNFSDLLPSILYSFLFTLVFHITSMICLTLLMKPLRKYFDTLAKGLWNFSTVLFLTLVLISWLSESSFMIATAVISFSALLTPLTKKYWESQFPENLAKEKSSKE